MAGLESLRTPEEVAELRGLSVNAVLGLTEKTNGATATLASRSGAVDVVGAPQAIGEPEEKPV